MDPRVYFQFSTRCTRLDPSFGVKTTIKFYLNRTTTEILCLDDSSQQTLINEHNTTSSISLELSTYPLARIIIFLTLLGLEDELQIRRFLARSIYQTAEQFGHGHLGLHIDVNIEMMTVRSININGEDLGVENESENRGGVLEDVLKMLKRETRFNGGDLMERCKKEGDCSICLQGLFSGACKIIKMPCSHLFHQSCIFTWLQTKNSCPMCRQIPFADKTIFR